MSDEQVGDGTELQRSLSSRRRVLAGAGMIGAAAGAVAVLGACGTDPNDHFEVPDPPASPGDGPPATEAPPTEAPEEEPEDDAPADGLAATSDVEVGGGLILADEDLVITQPVEGQWKGFSATCTHQGCGLSSISNGTINCDCHGSQFSIEDGSVVRAAYGGDVNQQNPLPEVALAVDGDQIVRA